MKHKILIDCMALLSPLTGIGRYNYEIAKNIALLDCDLELKYYYGLISSELMAYNNTKKNAKSTTVSYLKKQIVKIESLKKIALTSINYYNGITNPKFDIYWQPNFIPRKGIRSKNIIATVHDFSCKVGPHWHPKERIENFEKNFWTRIKKANHLITGSNFTKNEILHYLNFKEDQIDVIYHGVDHEIFYKTDSNSLNLPQNYILAVGSVEPRKNLLTLMKAYDSLSSEFKNEFKLVLAGFKGWNNSEIMDLIESNKEHILYLGFITDDELREVYSRASIFVYPSIYEGFGIPPLEAMACGTPVISSSASSLPEACGDCAIYIDPLSQNEIANAIKNLAGNMALRTELSNKGLLRAKEFTWEKSAQQHIDTFYKML